MTWRLMASVRWLVEEAGISKGAVEKALRDLQKHGFIVAVQGGHLGVEGKGQGTLWRLTELGYAGDRPTQDYKQWRPENESPSQKKGQAVPRDRTLSEDGVPRDGTRCPTRRDSFGPETVGPCPTRRDDLQYAKGEGDEDADGTIVDDDSTSVISHAAPGGFCETRTLAVISGGVVTRVAVRTDRRGRAPEMMGDEAFEALWSAYPEISKPRNARMSREARIAFDEALARGVSAEDLIARAHAYRAHIERCRLSPTQTKFPARWLREQQPTGADAREAQAAARDRRRAERRRC